MALEAKNFELTITLGGIPRVVMDKQFRVIGGTEEAQYTEALRFFVVQLQREIRERTMVEEPA